MSTTLETRLVLRNDTAVNWTSVNPVMLKGETGIEIDTKKFKFGDGVTAWNSLAYVVNSSGTDITFATSAEAITGTSTDTAISPATLASTIAANVLTADSIPALDASKITTGVIDSARLPSYVDDVLEVANYAALPTTGEAGKIYITVDTNKEYRWSGTVYSQITSGAVDSVNGKTSIVVLTTSDIAEGTNQYYTDAKATANFGVNIATTASTALSDSATLLRATDTFILNGGNA